MTAFYGRGPLVLASAAALAVVSLGLGLGSWQLRRAEEKASLQLAQDRALAAPPIELGALRIARDGSSAEGFDRGAGRGAGAVADSDTLPPAGAPPLPAAAAVQGLRVQASGVFASDRTIFLDNRTREGIAGFHVLTPLKLAGRDEHVMVLRGWIPRDPNDRNRLPTVPAPKEPVTVVGLAVADLPQPMMLANEPVPGPGDRLWQHFEYRKFSEWSGISLYPVVLRQTVEPGYRDGLARDWIQPGLSVDRHRGYAFQWFAMSAAAVVTWMVLLWRFKVHNDLDRVGHVAGR